MTPGRASLSQVGRVSPSVLVSRCFWRGAPKPLRPETCGRSAVASAPAYHLPARPARLPTGYFLVGICDEQAPPHSPGSGAMRWNLPRALARTLPVVLWLGTAACGGGGGGGLEPSDPGGGGGPPPGDPATSLAPKATFTDADLRHFLTRTHFGVKASELATVKQVGLPAYAAQMLQFPPVGSTAVEQAADALLVNDTDPPGLEGGFPTEGQLVRWWAYMMQRTARPFQEVVAMFWHDHFAAANVNLEPEELWWTKGHVNLWRGEGTGNLKDLCVTMARDALMLNWLDGTLNTVLAPNENFGREWWELFTLGADNGYVQ